MQNQKENLFIEKFKLLNSQEYNEEINWSSSPTSDVENSNNNLHFSSRHFLTRSEKRKRKNKVPKNISNLDIKVIDGSVDSKDVLDGEKSPILYNRSSLIKTQSSPIFVSNNKRSTSNRFEMNTNYSVDAGNRVQSPILATRIQKSPILLQKTSPASHKVRKPVFEAENNNFIKKEIDYSQNKEKIVSLSKKKDISNNFGNINCDIDLVSQSSKKIKIEDDISPKKDYLELGEKTVSEVSKRVVLERVKSFFDSHFSSENTSQSSIYEDITPTNSSNSDEIQIFTCKSQVLPDCPKQENSTTANNNEGKKYRYKKDGLAFRLSSLLKKQNAHVNLWQHEKFLAENANFAIPKSEKLIFYIKSVEIKFGCHLLNAIDVNEDDCIILINIEYVLGNILDGSVFKLYKPYKISSFNNMKLITNVCKFEHHLLT